jgi:hypothetical protein
VLNHQYSPKVKRLVGIKAVVQVGQVVARKVVLEDLLQEAIKINQLKRKYRTILILAQPNRPDPPLKFTNKT